MKVMILTGLRSEDVSEADQQEFLKLIGKYLGKEYNLPIEKIESERPTGGPVIMTLSEMEIDQFTRAFLSFASALSEIDGKPLTFNLEIDGVAAKFVGDVRGKKSPH